MKCVDVAIAIVARTGEVLICQRPDGVPFSGYWEFPGGKLEPGETPEQCLVRELREETGATVAPEVAFPPIEHSYPHARVRLHAFVCRLIDGEPRPVKCSACRWVPPSALREVRFPPANQTLIDQILANFAAPGATQEH